MYTNLITSNMDPMSSPPVAVDGLVGSLKDMAGRHLSVMQDDDVLDILKIVHKTIIQSFQITFLIFWFSIVTPIILINYLMYYLDMTFWNILLYPLLFPVYFWLGISFWVDPEVAQVEFKENYPFIYANLTRWAKVSALPIVVYLNLTNTEYTVGQIYFIHWVFMTGELIPGLITLLFAPLVFLLEVLVFWLGGVWWYEDISAYQGVTYDNAPGV